MNSLRSYFGARTATSASTHSLTALDEPKALQDAMVAAGMILDDDVDGAETELAKGTSPYHKLGRGVVSFLRAVLGFEQEVMKEASSLLGEAETAATTAQSHSHKSGYKSAIYPPGSEYALCHAEAQLMAAVVGVLNESLTEAIKSFYRLRKAYITLQEIADAETKFIESYKKAHASSMATPTTTGTSTPLQMEKPSPLRSTLLSSDADTLATERSLDDLTAKTAAVSIANPPDDKMPPEAIQHPKDLFVHTGTSLCFGVLQLLLSLVPPTFSKLLSIVGFRGERSAGLRMLWAAAEHTDHVNGGIAALVLLDFYNNVVGFCDIIQIDPATESKRRELLAAMRKKYPNGKFWLLQASSQLSSDKNIEGALELLMNDRNPSPLKQVEALRWFQGSLMNLNIGEYEKCAEGFLKCCDLNNWSQGLYYYIAASCYVELYRATEDAAQREKYKTRAKELLDVIPTKTGKRRFMARQLPFDAFVSRKYSKWSARAGKLGCDIIDAIGFSPAEEMVFFWGGNKRRSPTHLEAALARIKSYSPEAEDDVVVQQLFTAMMLQGLGRFDDALEIYRSKLIDRDLSAYKAAVEVHADMWPLPVATYEMAVCYWDIYKATSDEAEKQKALAQCKLYIDKVSKWEAYELDTRIGMKVRAAQETLQKLEVEHKTA